MRESLSRARLLTGALVALAIFAATVSTAFATSSTSTTNGLAVTASLSPDAVTSGQTVTQSESVKNVTDRSQQVIIRIVGPRPTAAPVSMSVTLAPNATFAQSTSFPAAQLSKGSHSLTVVAVNSVTRAGAQATASITVN